MSRDRLSEQGADYVQDYRRFDRLYHNRVLGLTAAAEKVTGRDATASERIFDDIRQHDRGLAIWWTGHNGWLVKSDGLLLGTDLVLDDQSREHPSPISAAEIAGELDISFINLSHPLSTICRSRIRSP